MDSAADLGEKERPPMIVKVQKKDWFTVPNLLGYLRLLLIPVFILLYCGAESPREYWLSVAVMGISSLSDMLDGLLARKLNQVTDLGKLLDPVADKLTQCALAFCLARRFPMMWVMVGILVVKESFMAIMGFLILRHNGCKLDGAKWFGKVSTAFLYVAVFLLLVVPGMKDALANGLILVSCGLLLLSLGGYIPEYRRLWKLPQNEA